VSHVIQFTIFQVTNERNETQTGCCSLKVCIPPKFKGWTLVANVMILGSMALRRWFGHEGRGLINRISVLIKKDPERFLAPPPCKDTDRSHSLWTRKHASPDTKSADSLVLDLSSSSNVRNKFLLFMIHLLYGILLQKPKYSKTQVFNTWGISLVNGTIPGKCKICSYVHGNQGIFFLWHFLMIVTVPDTEESAINIC
jgi:hypothetical protein